MTNKPNQPIQIYQTKSMNLNPQNPIYQIKSTKPKITNPFHQTESSNTNVKLAESNPLNQNCQTKNSSDQKLSQIY